MADRSTALRQLAQEMHDLVKADQVAEGTRAHGLVRSFDTLLAAGHQGKLEAFATFLPPRLVQAARRRRCVTFFGAGISAEAGIPLWSDLLATLSVSPELTTEPELEHDPLTTAEVLAYQIGMPDLDEALRAAVRRARHPTVTHFLLSELYQDIYITTNYDCLFEDAWERLHGARPRIVTTDADLVHLDPDALHGKSDGVPIVFKLHGSVDRDAEELILSRSQYRRHYRTNAAMFQCIRSLLARSNTLFLGFSHRDPEITRLVEDVIHAFELGHGEADERPAFYSLQFNMRKRTPEIFAARGIVALHPPLSLQPPDDVDPRTFALTRSLIDFLGAIDSNVHDQLDLDDQLSRALARIEKELGAGLGALEALAADLTDDWPAVNADALARAGRTAGSLAGQGVYVLDAGGSAIGSWTPPRLTNSARKDADFRRRPYVRQARMYRESFVSATASSIFNGNATAFLCVPVLSEDMTYKGLVFSAFQVGAWDTPLLLQQEVEEVHDRQDVSFVLMDSHGTLLLPPNREFPPRQTDVDGEPGDANLGFDFERMRRLSRRDKLVERIWNNIVPLARDDDVLHLGEVEMYSVVAEVARTRWKLALSIPTRSAAPN